MNAPLDYMITTDVSDARQYCARFFEPMIYAGQTGLCLRKHGEIVAAILYDGFNGHNVWIQLAGAPGSPWLTRAAIKWAFGYPFRQMGAERISALVDANNQASCDFSEHIGFVHECTMPRASESGGDLRLYRMFREDCRYA